MKYNFYKAATLAALKRLQPATGNTIMPILDNILVEVTEKETYITATNMGVTIKETLSFGGSPSSFLLPFSETFNIFNTIKEDATIEVGERVTIKAGKEVFKLGKSEDMSHFPTQKDEDYLLSAIVDWEFFYSLTTALKFSKQQQNEYVLNNVGVEFEKGKINIIGIDGFQMFHTSLKTDYNGSQRIAVDKHFIKSVSGFQDAEIFISEKNIKATTNTTTVIGRLADVKFPNVNVFFERKEPDNVFVPKKEFQQVVSNVLVYRDSLGVYKTKLSFSENKIDVSFLNENYGQEYEGSVEAKNNSTIEKIHLNAKHLLQAINTIPLDVDMVNMSVTEENRAVYISFENSTILLQPFN